jgi:hypothetical protein
LKENENSPMTDRPEPEPERVAELDLDTLHPFQNHPFKVREDEAMMDTAESIRRYGIIGCLNFAIYFGNIWKHKISKMSFG